MTADVQRELAEKVVEVFVNVLLASRQSAVADLNVAPRQWGEEAARQLAPLIADAEKRAAAGALRDAADGIRRRATRMSFAPKVHAQHEARLLDRSAAALDPSGAAEGAGR